MLRRQAFPAFLSMASRQAVLLTPLESSRLKRLPFCKQIASVSPLFAALAKSAHLYHSIRFSCPLFSCSYALFCTLLQKRKAQLLCFLAIPHSFSKKGGGVYPFFRFWNAFHISEAWVACRNTGTAGDWAPEQRLRSLGGCRGGRVENHVFTPRHIGGEHHAQEKKQSRKKIRRARQM